MSSVLDRYPEINQASPEQKLAMIDALWESVRRSGSIPVPPEHLTELNRRIEAVRNDPSLALNPTDARALLRTR